LAWGIVIPWGRDQRNRPTQSLGSPAENDLLKRAIDALSIDRLWNHFGFKERKGRNPVSSPFRADNNPSLSVYDCGRRFKDHATGDSGDSFDFFQRATDQSAKDAFVPFVELAGLGAELKKSGNGSKPTKPRAPALTQLVNDLAIYYDPERTCYWMLDDRKNWIKINETSVTRHLTAAGFRSTRRQDETISETDHILNEIQRSMDVEYAGSLAGYNKGILEYSGKRLLILDSPHLIEPRDGHWPTFATFLETLLDAENTDQIKYFNGWMKIGLLSLRAQKPRPGQALVLAGKKDCGKSLLQSLITEMLGGRCARPYQYMAEVTPFNSDLFSAEHLVIEDEQPKTDIRSRRAFGTKIKEITAIDDRRAHKKFRDGLTLPAFLRLSISLNDETENLLILPPFDDSLADKLIIFKIEHRAVPEDVDTRSTEAREAFRARLSTELPAYIHYLLNIWEIEPELASHRYGVTHFQHPDILWQLGELAPETRLLQLIDTEIFKINAKAPLCPRTDPWEGAASKLECVLSEDSSRVRYLARELLSWQGACGTYLGRLKNQYPKRVSYLKQHRDRTWTINPP